MVTPKILYRIAAGSTLFFALTHGVGHFTRKSTTEPSALSTLQSMETTRIPMKGVTTTYDDFYTGMSLNLILSLLALSGYLWLLSSLAEKHKDLALQFSFPALFLTTGLGITGYLYFFAAPMAVSFIAAGLIAFGMHRLRRGIGVKAS